MHQIRFNDSGGAAHRPLGVTPHARSGSETWGNSRGRSLRRLQLVGVEIATQVRAPAFGDLIESLRVFIVVQKTIIPENRESSFNGRIGYVLDIERDNPWCRCYIIFIEKLQDDVVRSRHPINHGAHTPKIDAKGLYLYRIADKLMLNSIAYDSIWSNSIVYNTIQHQRLSAWGMTCGYSNHSPGLQVSTKTPDRAQTRPGDGCEATMRNDDTRTQKGPEEPYADHPNPREVAA